MKILKLGRTFKEGLRNFTRNKWLSFATVSILALSLYVVGATATLGIGANLILKNIEESVDISVYLEPNVTEKDAMEIKNSIKDFHEIKSVEYVSNDQALQEFVANTGDDPVISQALDEIGENPLLSSLIIKASDSNYYDQIVSSLEASEFRDKINNINYGKNKAAIEKLNKVVAITEKTGIVLGSIFIIISVLITFNTIRLNMYSRKKEFEIMRLVGASNMYVQMPSIFEGVLYGFSGSVVAILLTFITTRAISPLVQDVLQQGNLMSVYFQYFWITGGAILILGMFLGIVSSFIAIRRYLKV